MKVAIVFNKELSLGLIANASAVLGISLGKLLCLQKYRSPLALTVRDCC